MRDPRRFPFFFLVTVAALAALLGLAWTRHRIREWGHARAVRNLRIQWRLRPAPPVWCPPTNPALLQALDNRSLRDRIIMGMDLGPPTEQSGDHREYARTIPLPSPKGRWREIEIILETWGRSWKQSWVVVEDGVEVDSGCSAFYFCG